MRTVRSARWGWTALVLGLAGSGWASGVRVDSLGFRGLVPDEEVDIYVNPAYLGKVEGSRLYAGAQASWHQENSAGYESSYLYGSGYANTFVPVSFGRLGFGLDGRSSRGESASGGSFPSVQDSYEQSGGGSVWWSGELSPDLHLGIAAGGSRGKSREWDSSALDPSFSRHVRESFFGQIGLLGGEPGDTTGLVLNFDKGRDSRAEGNSASPGSKNWSTNLEWRPEHRRSDSRVDRWAASLGYRWSDFEYWGNTKAIPAELSFGRMIPGAGGRAWHLGAFGNGKWEETAFDPFAEIDSSGVLVGYINPIERAITLAGDFRLGVEQPVAGDRWTLRGSVSMAKASYTWIKATIWEADKYGNTSVSLLGQYTVGFGFQWTQDLAVDFNLDSNNAAYSGRSSGGPGLGTYDRAEVLAELAASWKF